MPMFRWTRLSRHPVLLAAVFAGLAASALAARLSHRPPAAPLPAAPLPTVFRAAAITGTVSWEETAWHMPLDNWGEGRVWRAALPGGGEVRLFARTKTGFCNCFDGIANDDEIDRIGDVDLHGDDFRPIAPGRVTTLGALPGRERLFRASGKWSGARHVLSLVVAADCKAVVATLVSNETISSGTEAAATALLTGEDFRHWAFAR